MSSQSIDRGTEWLTKGGVRPTRQRVALASLLVGDGKNRHVTAESLFAAAQSTGEQVSLATVYNTLRAFCEAGLMQEVTVDGARSYFDTNTHDHPHFFWEDDGRLTDAPADELEIARIPGPPEGAEISSVNVVIKLRRT
jgi:Fur family iron response transcriptional regulator